MPVVQSVARSSPPTQRVIAVLDFLARHPHDRFSLAELARRLQLAKPTCLGIVTALAEAGYLVRGEQDKAYRLGPSLIYLGHRAQESMRVSPPAGAELRRLSDVFNTTAALSAVVDQRITVLELVGPRGTSGGVRVGESYPFTPPVGLMFVLWDDQALRAWLGMTSTIPLQTDTQRLEHIVAECRSAGYLVERLTPTGRQLYALMAGISDDVPDELRALLAELVSGIGERILLRGEISGSRQRHEVSLISAPVYDHHHRQAMVVSLQIGRALAGAEIVKHARAVVASADALTVQLGGRKPQW